MCGKADIVVIAYCRVEQTTRNSEEDPCIDGEREAEAKTDVKQLRWVWALRKSCTLTTSRCLGCVGNLSPCKGKEAAPWSQFPRYITVTEHEGLQKEEGSHEFSSHGDEVIARAIG
jgi:hypothetical protein